MESSSWSHELTLQALRLDVATGPVASEQIVSGNPETGFTQLETWNGLEVGVWDMTPGIMKDIETEEMCIILEGSGTVERIINGTTVLQQLEPGAVFHLCEGEQTVWTVTKRVRKIYFAT